MNGKSGNLNNCGSQIYPPGTDIPLNEVMCIFDADQVAKRDFFLRTLPFFDGGDDVGMVLSPQVPCAWLMRMRICCEANESETASCGRP